LELTKEEKRELRSRLFRHLEGFPIVSVCESLRDEKITGELLSENQESLLQFSKEHLANEGYLNIALRLLCSQGWLKQTILSDGSDRLYRISPIGKIALQNIHLYDKAFQYMKIAKDFNRGLSTGFTDEELEILNEIEALSRNHWELHTNNESLDYQMRMHFEGIVVGPLLVGMGMLDTFEDLKKFNVSQLLEVHPQWEVAFQIFSNLGWFSCENQEYLITPVGEFFIKRASAYGVTVSYLPMFCWMDELLFGKADILWDKPIGSPEIHVDRTMNVWGSGGAHSTYFSKIDEIVIDIFNQPLANQPKGIADMGCGNGALLQHLYEVVKTKTERGKVLDEHPLLIVGSDFNEAALLASRKTLDKAGIHAHFLHGDIGHPEILAKDLNQKFGVDLGEMLNVRSFLDHNRVYEETRTDAASRSVTSTGAFAFRGKRIPNNELEQNLYEHFARWKPYIKKFGLLVIELHTISDIVVKVNRPSELPPVLVVVLLPSTEMLLM